jgi:hypothetical protein
MDFSQKSINELLASMEREESLQCSQEFKTWPYPKAAEISPSHHTHLLNAYSVNNISSYIAMNFNRHFEGIFRIHFEDRGISQARKQHEAGSKQSPGLDATYSSETSVDFQRST